MLSNIFHVILQHQHPYLSAMVNNGTWSYDHDRDGTHTQLAGCEVRFRNVDYETYISIRYENDVLSVSTDLENRNEWKNCFVVNNVELPTGYFFGLSATTGDLSDNHDIHSFKFFDIDTNLSVSIKVAHNLDVIEVNFFQIPQHDEIMQRTNIIPNAKTFEPPREHKEDPKPGMSNAKIFFILLCVVIVTAAVAIFAISYFKDRNARKRFY